MTPEEREQVMNELAEAEEYVVECESLLSDAQDELSHAEDAKAKILRKFPEIQYGRVPSGS